MSATSPAASPTLLGHRPFLLYFLARGFSEFSYQITAVAVGWQVYALTSSAFDLGIVGLVQFLPTAALVLSPAMRPTAMTASASCKPARSPPDWPRHSWPLAASLDGSASRRFLPRLRSSVLTTAFEGPAKAALLPGVVPEAMLQKGTALSTGAFQVAMISGPALGGLAYALSPGAPYALVAVFWTIAAVLNGAIRLQRPVEAKAPPTFASVFAGVGFVRRNPAILGTISLDLFAVLLGGATALLPIYARDILHTGPWGLGYCGPPPRRARS